MSSNRYTVTIQKIEANKITLRIHTGTSGGLNDLSCTRSFALALLVHSRRNAKWETKEISNNPILLEEESKSFVSDWYVNENFMKENVSNYIIKTEVLDRKNKIDELANNDWVDDFVNKIEANNALSPIEKENAYREKMHYFILEVTMIDSNWLQGIEEGWVFGTTAYDVWRDDPTNHFKKS